MTSDIPLPLLCIVLYAFVSVFATFLLRAGVISILHKDPDWFREMGYPRLFMLSDLLPLRVVLMHLDLDRSDTRLIWTHFLVWMSSLAAFVAMGAYILLFMVPR